MGVILLPFGFLFQLISSTRLWLYKTKFFKSSALKKPVISVGNLTVGGTGKTPFVDFLISQLEEKGLKVGLLTRGYGRSSDQLLSVDLHSKSEDVGDEPLWLKTRHPAAQVVVSGNRLNGAEKLRNVDVILLDDGMQHLKIKRDLEITLIDATAKDSDYWPLPAGKAREGFSALSRSDVVILTKTNLATEERVEEMADKIFNKGVMEVLESQIQIEKCVNIKTGESVSLVGKKCFLVSGIAQPQGFEKLVKQGGAAVIFHQVRPDHSTVSESKIGEFIKEAISKKAELLLITEKDAVKWKEVLPSYLSLPVCVLETKITFNSEIPQFYDLASYNFN